MIQNRLLVHNANHSQALHQTQNGYSEADLVHAASAAYVLNHTEISNQKGMVSDGTHNSSPHSFLSGSGLHQPLFCGNRQRLGQHGRIKLAVPQDRSVAGAQRCRIEQARLQTRRYRAHRIRRLVLDVAKPIRSRQTVSVKETGPEFSKNSVWRAVRRFT